MRFEIVIHNPHTTITQYASNAWDKNEKVYATLTSHQINEELSIDCASWCELAGDGDSYNTEDFDVYVSEE